MALDIQIKKRMRHFDLNLNIRIPDNELHALIGPSGGGKTTLLRLIAGLDQPDEGRISFGSEVWYDSLAGIQLPAQKRGLGYVFQEYTLFPHLSLLENAAFACKDTKEALRLMDLLGIAHLKNQKPHQVSGGERQRCAICQAVARKSKLLLFDEPFSALDCVTRRRLRDDIRMLREQTSSPMVYVTHDLTEAFALADAIVPVVDGRIDQNWLQSAIEPVYAAGNTARGVRRRKLALAQ